MLPVHHWKVHVVVVKRNLIASNINSCICFGDLWCWQTNMIHKNMLPFKSVSKLNPTQLWIIFCWQIHMGKGLAKYCHIEDSVSPRQIDLEGWCQLQSVWTTSTSFPHSCIDIPLHLLQLKKVSISHNKITHQCNQTLQLGVYVCVTRVLCLNYKSVLNISHSTPSQ